MTEQLTRTPGPTIRPLVRPVPAARRPVRHPHPEPHPEPPRGPHRAGQAARTARSPRAACDGSGPPHRPRTAAPGGAGHAELAGRFAHRLVEVLCGARPVHQLQRHTTLPGFHQLAALVRTGPLRPRGRVLRPRLGRVHDCAPGPGAVEACVRIELGPRHHVLAFRLERHARTGQWQCAAVETR
ncbi:Rv3235 family protein [Kitasatospora phosalacinea]|uniref:Rv3235 family protein n=1 Tax=Kitasatospora phosalacinea TaxID=2065 RepID=UPI0006917373|nr:Rv3235 family protein [Kitasatospora phosalacinea]